MVKRKANVNIERCVACGVCALQCPRQAISIHRGCYAAIEESICVGCGLCERACPASAIELKERELVND